MLERASCLSCRVSIYITFRDYYCNFLLLAESLLSPSHTHCLSSLSCALLEIFGAVKSLGCRYTASPRIVIWISDEFVHSEAFRVCLCAAPDYANLCFAPLHNKKCIITKINHAYLIYRPFCLLSSLFVLIIFHFLKLLLLLMFLQLLDFQPCC